MARILVIEDSPTEAHALRSKLESSGHQVELATTGDQGIRMAITDPPDLVLMDIVLPGVSGFQATRELNRSVRTRDIPIIIISTKSQEVDRIWGLRQGAVDYLVKPVDARLLNERIDAALSAVRESLA